jgi:hypothetical protein
MTRASRSSAPEGATYEGQTSRPGSMILPSDTRPVLWCVTGWLHDRPRVVVYDTTWTGAEAAMRALAQVRADASLPHEEWQQYSWTVLPHAHEVMPCSKAAPAAEPL